MTLETVERIEPARLENPSADIIDVIAELSASAAVLGKALHPMTATSLAGVVRIMNTYYSNLIEGHNTRPRDIERALSGEFDENEGRRNLQIEAAAHVRVQAKVDSMAQDGTLPPPASSGFLRWLHLEFFHGAPASMLTLKHGDRSIQMTPGEWRNLPEHDVAVGRHVPPSSARVVDFMRHFESRFRFDSMGPAARILTIASAHHRFNYIHPFPDGNGRVSRLMSHAMAAKAGIGAHGLWSISRGLARGLESRTEYKSMMDHADMPRQGDRDGRGNLSQAALQDFVLWFLRVCLDQVRFMSSLFDLEALAGRIHRYVERHEILKPEAGFILESVLLRGELERGDAMRASGLPERTARRVLGELLSLGLLASDTPKGKVSLRFPSHALEDLFPKLYPQS
jgi:Fic family protein